MTARPNPPDGYETWLDERMEYLPNLTTRQRHISVIARAELAELRAERDRLRKSALRLLDAYWQHVHNATPDDKPDGLRAVTDCLEIVRGVFEPKEDSDE